MSARLRARATMAKSVALAGRSRPDWAPPRAARQFRSLLDGPVMNFLGVRSSRRTPSALRARAPGRSRGAPLEATRATPHRRRSGPRALGSARAVRRPRASGGRGHRAPAPRRMPRLNPPPTQQVAGRPRAPAFGGYPADPSVSAEHSALSLEVRAGDARDASPSTIPPLDPVPDPPPRAIERDRSIAQRPTSRRNKPKSQSIILDLRRREPSSSSRVCASRTKKTPARAPPPPDSNRPPRTRSRDSPRRSSPRARRRRTSAASPSARRWTPSPPPTPKRRSGSRATPRGASTAPPSSTGTAASIPRAGGGGAASAAAITRTRRSPPGPGRRRRSDTAENSSSRT